MAGVNACFPTKCLCWSRSHVALPTYLKVCHCKTNLDLQIFCLSQQQCSGGICRHARHLRPLNQGPSEPCRRAPLPHCPARSRSSVSTTLCRLTPPVPTRPRGPTRPTSPVATLCAFWRGGRALLTNHFFVLFRVVYSEDRAVNVSARNGYAFRLVD